MQNICFNLCVVTFTIGLLLQKEDEASNGRNYT